MPKKFNKKNNNNNNFNKPKFNNNLKKTNQKNVSAQYCKSFDDNNDNFGDTKWLKVTCLNESESSVDDIIVKIENLLYRFANKSVSLKPINIYVNNNNILEFYVSMKKYLITVVLDNAFKIDGYRLRCSKSDDVHVPHELPTNWTELLKQTINNRYRMNESTGLIEINLSAFAQDELLTKNGLHLSLSSSRVFESVLNLLKSALNHVSILDLSGNNISSIFKLKSFCECVKIDQLDLRNNRISSVSEFNSLAPSSIIDLKIWGNQLRKISAQELRKTVRSAVPTLISLDGTKLEEPNDLPQSILSVDRGSEMFKFILRYLSTFDINRNQIHAFYSKESNLSIATHGDSLPIYWNNNMNISVSKNRSKSDRWKVRRGAGEITELFKQFPDTKHIEQSIQVEMVQQSNAAIICNVHGVFIEFGTANSPGCRAREFTRNMTIVPAGDSPIVLQEHIHLMPNDAALYLKFKPIINQYRDVTKARPDLIGVSCEIIQWAKELSETPGIGLDDSIDLLMEIVRVYPQWNFSSQDARMVKSVKDETGLSVMESIECLNGILKVNSDVSNVSIDLIKVVKQFKDATGMPISFSIDFLAKHDSLGEALVAFEMLRDNK